MSVINPLATVTVFESAVVNVPDAPVNWTQLPFSLARGMPSNLASCTIGGRDTYNVSTYPSKSEEGRIAIFTPALG